jgi:hypothetical protein
LGGYRFSGGGKPLRRQAVFLCGWLGLAPFKVHIGGTGPFAGNFVSTGDFRGNFPALACQHVLFFFIH